MSKLMLNIRISIVDVDRPYGGLELSETHEIGTGSFFEAATVLSRFHELTETFKEKEKS